MISMPNPKIFKSTVHMEFNVDELSVLISALAYLGVNYEQELSVRYTSVSSLFEKLKENWEILDTFDKIEVEGGAEVV